MALPRLEQLLSHEILSPAQLFGGLVYTSHPIPISTEAGWALLVRIESAPSGASPSIVWEVDLSDNGAAYARVGGAIAALTAVGALLVPYYTNSTQGLIIPSYNSTHTYLVQVKATMGAADNVFPSVSADLIAI